MTTYEKLDALAKGLKEALPGVSFGYIGNVGVDRYGRYDDRSWSVFLPHPGRVGTWEDKVGSYRTADLDRMLADWPSIVTEVRRRWSVDA